MAVASVGGVNLGGLLVPIVFFGMLYFIAIRPQKKRQKEIQEMRDGLSLGDKVITIGGIHGKIVQLKDEAIIVEAAPDNIKVETTRWAVGSIVDKNE